MAAAARTFSGSAWLQVVAVRAGAQPRCVYLALGFSPAAALALGLPLALSSTAQVLPMLRAG